MLVLKVISGSLKGRTVEGFDLEGTRPTMDRVKESLFATIQNYIADSVVLDLFAGSGNLGIEAISNGSKMAYLNDISDKAIKVIRKNISNFKIEDSTTVLNMDYKKCLKHLSDENIKFDIIFLDPPYKKLIVGEIIEFICINNLLKEEGIIVCEVSDNYLNEYMGLEKIKEKKYGDKQIIIFKKCCK